MDMEFKISNNPTPEEVGALTEAAISNIQGNLACLMEMVDPFSPLYEKLTDLRDQMDDIVREVYRWESP